MNIQHKTIYSTILMIESRIGEGKVAHADLSWGIRDLEELQRGLHRERNFLLNQITLISSLPNELLGVIFEALAFKASPKSPSTKIILSHISQWFHSIATNMCLLWTQINISHHIPFNMVKAYLQRSGFSPFNFHFIINNSGYCLPEFHSLYSNVEWQTILSCMNCCCQFSIQSSGYHIT
jgi:hypothetical protein